MFGQRPVWGEALEEVDADYLERPRVRDILTGPILELGYRSVDDHPLMLAELD